MRFPKNVMWRSSPGLSCLSYKTMSVLTNNDFVLKKFVPPSPSFFRANLFYYRRSWYFHSKIVDSLMAWELGFNCIAVEENSFGFILHESKCSLKVSWLAYQ